MLVVSLHLGMPTLRLLLAMVRYSELVGYGAEDVYLLRFSVHGGPLYSRWDHRQ